MTKKENENLFFNFVDKVTELLLAAFVFVFYAGILFISGIIIFAIIKWAFQIVF